MARGQALACLKAGFALLDASKDDLRGDGVEFHVAAGWEVREALSDAQLQFLSCAAEERAEASIESELFAVVAYEVEDGAGCLSLGAAQASAQLLEEEGWAVGGAEEEEGVQHRDVDAFVEEVDGEEEEHVSDQTATDGMLASLKTRAMNRAWAMFTQKPRVRMVRLSSTRSMSLAITCFPRNKWGRQGMSRRSRPSWMP